MDNTALTQVPTYSTPLYQLTGDVARVLMELDQINANETMDPDARAAAIDAALKALADSQEAIEVKLENCAKYRRSLEREAEMLKAEEAALADKRRAVAARIDRFDDYIKHQLLTLEGHKAKAGSFSFSLRRSKSLEITDQQLLPPATGETRHLWRFSPPELDKRAVKEAIEAGQEIGGVKIVENVSLQIK